MRGVRRAAVLGSLAVLGQLLLLPSEHAVAAFPGTNGKIVFNAPLGNLFTVNPDGSGRTDLGIVGARAAWSPDGRKIAFTRTDQPGTGDEGSETVEIFTADADGSNLIRLTTSGGLKHEVSWSPDGRRIVFYLTCEGCSPDSTIRVVDADGANERALTDFYSFDPAWSPDGKEIAFVGAGSDGLPDLYVMNSDGTCPRTIGGIPDGLGVPQTPHWSPNGREIVFSAPSPSDLQQDDLFVIGRDGSGFRRLTNTTTNERSPAWSPDGSTIVFHRFPLGTGLSAIDADGSNERSITLERDAFPDWQRLPLGTSGPSSDAEHGVLSGPILGLAADLPEPLGGPDGLLATTACMVLEPVGL